VLHANSSIRCSNPRIGTVNLINKSECVCVCVCVCLWVCMFEINSLTPQPIQTKFGVAIIRNPAENIGYIRILSL
jgi:hypothetical protein